MLLHDLLRATWFSVCWNPPQLWEKERKKKKKPNEMLNGNLGTKISSTLAYFSSLKLSTDHNNNKNAKN